MIPSSILMGLGVFRFAMTQGAYETFTRTASYRWGKLDRIGADPDLQYMGPETGEIKIEGTIFPHFRGGLTQIARMRSAAESAQPMMMVDGVGAVWKQWIIIRVEERQTFFLMDGLPRKIEFALELQRYTSRKLTPDLPKLRDLTRQADVQ